MTRLQGFSALFLFSFINLHSVASTPISDAIPPPGEYQIDSISTSTVRSLGETIESVQQVDGATGNTTLTQKSSQSPNPVITKIVGQGPVRFCQGHVSSVNTKTECVGSVQSDAQQWSATIPCNGVHEASWRKLGGNVWEKHVHSKPSPTPSMTMPAQTQAAMAPVIEKMRERLKTAPADEAAVIRQQLQAFTQNQVPATPMPEMDLTERWTLVSQHCGVPAKK